MLRPFLGDGAFFYFQRAVHSVPAWEFARIGIGNESNKHKGDKEPWI